MILPENGSIVIIDDKINQALPLINALSGSGLSTTFYTGKEECLPKTHLEGTRLVIADLQLIDTDNDAHTIATRLVQILQKIIPLKNGPYILLIWSLKESFYADEVKREVSKKENNVVPILIVELEKSKCIEQVTKDDKLTEFREKVMEQLKMSTLESSDLKLVEESINRNWMPDEESEYRIKPDALKLIEQNIEEGLKKAGVFHLFVIWENLIRKAGYQTVNTVCSTIEYTDLWEMNMQDVLRRLGQARTGKNELPDTLFLKESMTTFSGSFADELEYEIRRFKLPNYIKLEFPFSISGKINDDQYSIDIYTNDKGIPKVRLLKNDEVFNGKEGIKLDKINSVSNDLEGEEKHMIEDLVNRYSEIPDIINTKLHCEFDVHNIHTPGNIYKRKVTDDKKKEYLKSYFESVPEDVSNYHFIELEVSPICDYANKKWKKSRLLSGIVYPVSSKKPKPGPFYKESPKIIIEDKKYSLVFNYLLFKALDVSDVEVRGKPWFRIKRELLLDIITGLSGHINRPGITTII